MSKFDSPLNNIRIASPCSADWDQMYGDDRKRFCGDCKLNVYNLSGMSRDEAEALIMKAEGRLCVRFYQRRDGSVITQDCPVGWARVKQRTRVIATAAFSLLMALISGVFFVSLFAKRSSTMGEMRFPVVTPIEHTMGAVSINANTVKRPDDGAVMGNYAGPVEPTMGKMKVVKTPYRD
jgi:hypothetical protein